METSAATSQLPPTVDFKGCQKEIAAAKTWAECLQFFWQTAAGPHLPLPEVGLATPNKKKKVHQPFLPGPPMGTHRGWGQAGLQGCTCAGTARCLWESSSSFANNCARMAWCSQSVFCIFSFLSRISQKKSGVSLLPVPDRQDLKDGLEHRVMAQHFILAFSQSTAYSQSWQHTGGKQRNGPEEEHTELTASWRQAVFYSQVSKFARLAQEMENQIFYIGFSWMGYPPRSYTGVGCDIQWKASPGRILKRASKVKVLCSPASPIWLNPFTYLQY